MRVSRKEIAMEIIVAGLLALGALGAIGSAITDACAVEDDPYQKR
jgi:hypothetical protein